MAKPPRNQRIWTDEEDAFLAEKWRAYSKKELAKALGRSRHSINWRIWKLTRDGRIKQPAPFVAPASKEKSPTEGAGSFLLVPSAELAKALPNSFRFATLDELNEFIEGDPRWPVTNNPSEPGGFVAVQVMRSYSVVVSS